jgi:hypothetical protein
VEIKKKEERTMQKRNKKTRRDKEECEEKKKRNCSGVGIQLIPAIIIIQCNRYSLMKRESAGELLILSESSSIHPLFFLIYSFVIVLENTVIMVFERLSSYPTWETMNIISIQCQFN